MNGKKYWLVFWNAISGWIYVRKTSHLSGNGGLTYGTKGTYECFHFVHCTHTNT